MKTSKAQKKRNHGIKSLERKVDVYTKKAEYYKQQLKTAKLRAEEVDARNYIGKCFNAKNKYPNYYKVVCVSNGNLFGTILDLIDTRLARNRFEIHNMYYIDKNDLGNEISHIVFNRELDKLVNTIKTQTKRTYGYR